MKNLEHPGVVPNNNDPVNRGEDNGGERFLGSTFGVFLNCILPKYNSELLGKTLVNGFL